MPDSPLNSRHVRRRFDRAATNFGHADFVHRRTADAMLQRMQPMTVEPQLIVDLGAAAGSDSAALARRFRRARVIGIDFSLGMLRQARRNRRWLSKPRDVCADACQLPLRDGAVDLVFANLLLPWIDPPDLLFREVARVMRRDGLFVFSSLGPASLVALRDAWCHVDGDPHVHRFADMHDIGDALLRNGLRDPVLDVDPMRITYRNADALLADLTASGSRNCLHDRRRSLTGKQRFAAFVERLERGQVDGILPLGLEIVFGHAWGAGARDGARVGTGEFAIDPATIGKRRS
jgi:malonyl-CoA O-methyltransferase